MSKVKILKTSLVIVLIALITFGVGITLALNSNEVKIEISEVPNIDVVLSKAKTNVNLSTFEKDLKDKLEEEGVDLSKVKISAIETNTISSSDMNASEIFNSWQQYPALNASMFNADWRLEGDYIRTTVDTHWTGFWNKSAQNDSDYTIEFDIKTDDPDPLGFTFRMNENSTNNYQFYALEFSPAKSIITLAKVNSWIPNANDRRYGGPILHGVVNEAYWLENGQYVIHDYRTTENGQALTHCDVERLVYEKNSLKYSEWYKVKIVASGNNIRVYVNDSLIINYTDETNPILQGGYGPYTLSNSKGFFKNVTVSTENIKTIKEILQEPEWRNDSLRFLINVEDNTNTDYDDDAYLANISTKLTNNDIHFLGWGTDSNKTQVEKIIKTNNNKGEYMDNTDYEKAIQRTAEYIKEEVEKYQTASKTKKYILVDMPHNIVVDPEEIRENTTDRLYTEGKWKINHDYEYFENNNGQYNMNGKYTDALIKEFDKVGKYEIIYQKDKVAEVYVHRKPEAQFTVEIDGTNVKLNDLSYDLDEQSKNNGISETEWSYKKVSEENWTTGKLTTMEDDTYIVRLRVKDHQDTWSEYETKYVTKQAGEPIAAFQVVNNKTSIYEDLEIVDTSYDPSGLKITERKWTLFKDDKEIYSGSTAPTTFKDHGTGNYKLTLTVKNSNGVQSEEFRQNFSIINDEIAPEIIVDTPESNSLNEIKVNVKFIDKGGSGFNSYKYAITDSKEPVTEWSEDIAENEKDFILNTLGEQYIHIIAKDNAGNETEEIILGPYVIEPKSFTLEIEKYDGNDSTVKLGGIEFLVKQPSSETFETREKTLKTDENGYAKAELNIVNSGENIYTISEKTAMLGYEDLKDVQLKINVDENGNILTAEEDSDKVNIDLKTKDTIRLKIANVQKSTTGDGNQGGNTGDQGEIRLIKFNINNIDENNEVVPNVKYQVKIEDGTGRSITKELTTDKDGNIKIENIPFSNIASITYKQIEIGDEYIINSEEKKVVVIYENGTYRINDLLKADIVGTIDNQTGEVKITVINYKKSEKQKLRLELNASNDNDMKLNGQELKITLPYRIGEKVLTTNEEGIIEMELDSPGPGDHIYTITPSKTSDEYNIQEVKIVITFDNDGKVSNVRELTNHLSKKAVTKDITDGIAYNCVDLVYSLNINDEYGGQKFRIELQDSDYNVKKIPGAVYQIKVETENGINTIVKTTDSLGEITLTLAKKDWVKLTIEEIKTIDGYTLDKTVRTVSLKLADTEEGKRLVVDNQETTSGLKIEEKGKDKIITLVLDNLAKLSDEKDVQGTIDFFITKKDFAGNLLGNVAFELEETVTGVKETLITDKDGYVELHDIEIPGEGKYEFKIHELNTVNGYQLPDTEIIMNVTYQKIDGELKTSDVVIVKGYRYIETKHLDEYETPETYQTDATMIIMNNAKPLPEDPELLNGFSLYKTDEGGKALEGAEFEVTIEYENGTSVKNTYETKKPYKESTVSSFNIESLNIEDGEKAKIIIKEVKAPLGYELDAIEKVIAVKKENGKIVLDEDNSTKDLEIEVQNEKNISLKLTNKAMEKEPQTNEPGDKEDEPEYVPVYYMSINKYGATNNTRFAPVVGATFQITVEYEDGMSKTFTEKTVGTKYEDIVGYLGHVTKGVCTAAGIKQIDFSIKDEEDNVIRDIENGDKVKITVKELDAPGYIIDKEEKVIVVKRVDDELVLVDEETTNGLSISKGKTTVALGIRNEVEQKVDEPPFYMTIHKTDLEKEYNSIFGGIVYSISIQYEDGIIQNIKRQDSTVKNNYKVVRYTVGGKKYKKYVFTHSGVPTFSLHYVDSKGDTDPTNDIEKYIKDGEKVVIKIKEVSAPKRCVIDPTEIKITVQRDGDKLKLIEEETTEGYSISLDASERNIVAVFENEILPPDPTDPSNPSNPSNPNDPNDPTDPNEGPKYDTPTTVLINSISKYTEDWVASSRFKLTIKNSNGDVIKEMNSQYSSSREYSRWMCNTLSGYYTSTPGEYVVEIEEDVPGYLHKLNTEKYTLAFERFANGSVKINKDKTSEELEATTGWISGGRAGYVGVYVTIKNEPAYGLTVNKVNDGNSYSISGAGFSIIEEEYEFDENAFVSGYGVTVDGNALLQIRNQDSNTTRRYVITEEVIPNGYNRMGEHGKALIEVKTDKYGYIEDAKIIEKDGYDGEDVCELIYSEDKHGNQNLASIRIKDKPISKTSYSIKIEKVDENNESIKLPNAKFSIYGQSEKTTYFKPLNNEPPYEFEKIDTKGHKIRARVVTNGKGIAQVNGLTGTGDNVISIWETKSPTGYGYLGQAINIVLNREISMETKEDGTVQEVSHLKLKSATNNDKVKVTLDHEKQEVKVVVKDTPEYDILITKTSTSGTNFLSGAEFTLEKEIYSKDQYGNWAKDEELNKNLGTVTLTTDKYGRVGYIEDYLPNKRVKYTVKEVKAPYMYLKYEEPIEFTVMYNYLSNIVEADMTSENKDEDGMKIANLSKSIKYDCVYLSVMDKFDPNFLPNDNNGKGDNDSEKTTIQLVKEDKDDDTIKIENATFQFIFSKDEQVSGSVVETTDENGEINFKQIWNEETTLEISEAMAPEGYRDYEGEVKINLKKDEYGNITVTDVNKNEVIGNIGKDEDGEDREDDSTYEIQYDETNKILKVVLKDELKDPSIAITKVCANDKTLKVTDVEFKVKDETTDEIHDLITGPEGTGIVTIKGKEKGTYEFRIREAMAADGFELLEEEITLEVEYGDNEEIVDARITSGGEHAAIITRDSKRVGIEVTNDVKETEYETDYNVIIRKADRDDYEYVLPGAELKIDIDNEIGPKGITKTDITDKNGEIAISNLNGTGTIKIGITEITPPTGRKFNLQKKYVEVKRDLLTGRMKLEISDNADTLIDNVNKIITIVVRNEVESSLFNVAIDKRDKENHDILLPDVPLQFSLDEVFEMSEITNDKGTAYFGNIEKQNIGTYKFKIKELKAPVGYKQLSDDVTLEVTFGGKEGKLVILSAKILDKDKELAEVTRIEDSYIRLNLYNEAEKGGTPENPGEDGGDGEDGKGDSYTFRLHKVDEEYPEIGIRDVKFGIKITAESGENVYVEEKTDENGIIEINGVRGTGNIVAKVKEITGATGYEIDTAEKEIDYTRDSESKLISVAEVKGNMTGNTYDEDKNVEVYVTNKLSGDYFNMHLEKYLSHINGKQISEGPTVTIENGKVTYKKDEITEKIKIGDELIYTIRVYNDGTQNGYAKTILDNIPEGLEFLERHEINRKYEWKLAENGNVETNYLSKENESNQRDNLIHGFNKEEDSEIDYRDVQIAFKLVGKKGAENIANKAELKETTDEDGKIIDNNGRNEKDDETEEKIDTGYTDLDTTKYISKIIVKDTGKNTVKEYEYGEEKSGVQKIEISRNRINQTKISIEYTIKVTNKGNIAGPIEKLIDYIPEGLEFNAEDNQGWEIVDGNAENIDLRGTILEAGESREVTIRFTWKQSSTNFGGIKNVAIADGGENEIDNGRNNGTIGEDGDNGGNLEDKLKDTDNAGDSTIIVAVNTGGMYTAGIIITLIILVIGGASYKVLCTMKAKKETKE